MTERADTTDRHETSRRIRASADLIFSTLADPVNHVAIDSSEMLLDAPDAAPVSPSTDVTSYCDWTDVPDAARQFLSFPVISVDALDRTLDELARRVEER